MLHIRTDVGALNPPRYEVHSMPVAPLCATPGGHPVGRDVFGPITDHILDASTGICRLCAKAYRERLAAAVAAAHQGLAWAPRGTPPARTEADVVVDLRAALRLSQAGLARRLGTTQTVVSRWETGEHTPRRSIWVVLRGLAAAGGERCSKVLKEIDTIKEKERDD